MTACFSEAPLVLLLSATALALLLLCRGADWLIEEAVALSTCWRVNKAFIGATIVSLGTTLPEVAVSVFAAIQGHPDLALGNAAGSILCNSGLILGLAALITPLPLVPSMVRRQGYIKIGAVLLLIALALPLAQLASVFSTGGRIPRWAGFSMLALLGVYLYASFTWARREGKSLPAPPEAPARQRTCWILLKLGAGLLLVVLSSRLLIPAVEELARRAGVPQSVLAATLVAFGTSLPELVTALTAVRRGHGEIAVGNVIGADILNVLFVAGAATAVTRGGLDAPPEFFFLYFPAILLLLVVFHSAARGAEDHLKRPVGALLLLIYLLVAVLGYIV